MFLKNPSLRNGGFLFFMDFVYICTMKWNTKINLDEHNVWFTADLHLYHSNILWMNKRPFENCDQMWEHIKNDWNSKVKDDDYVFILGDVLWGSSRYALARMKNSLKGHICIVMGNHDKEKDVDKTGKTNFDVFDSYERLEYIQVVSEKLGIMQNVFLSHYPTYTWPQKGRGSIHLHGHVHGIMDAYNEKSPDLRVDVGMDGKLAYMRLISFDEVYNYFIHKAGDMPLTNYMAKVYADVNKRMDAKKEFDELVDRADAMDDVDDEDEPYVVI